MSHAPVHPFGGEGCAFCLTKQTVDAWAKSHRANYRLSPPSFVYGKVRGWCVTVGKRINGDGWELHGLSFLGIHNNRSRPNFHSRAQS